jgi:site-specific DNA recombinase
VILIRSKSFTNAFDLLPNAVAEMVPPSDRVQQMLLARDVAGVRHRRHEHYLKGLLHRGECGRRLVPHPRQREVPVLLLPAQRGPARTGCRQLYIVAKGAEPLVVDLYRRIQLPTSWVSRLTEELEAEIVERQTEASERLVLLTRTLAKLADERGKPLQAFYANAIPLELSKTEQDRIGIAEYAAKDKLQTTEDDLEGWRDVLRTAIRLAGNCHTAYPEGETLGSATLQRRRA